MRSSSFRLPAVLAVFTASATLAQDTPQTSQKTGTVSGSVVDAKSGDPLAKAMVIVRQGQDGGIAEITGPDGKFSIRILMPGAYIITAERDGYVVPQRRPRTINVQPGQDISSVALRMVRTGTISGRVLDVDGDPISGVSVVVAPVLGSRNRPSARLYFSTNDLGQYRAFHIAPGDYRISAVYTPRNRAPGLRIQRRKTGDVASLGEAYPAVYYPGTIDLRQAATVTVDPGAELTGFDLQLVRAHWGESPGTCNSSGW